MEKWINGAKLINDERWTPTELLNHIKNGLPCYDPIVDWRLYDPDTLPRQKQTIEEITKKMQQRFVDCDPPCSLIEYAFENQTGTPICPQDGKMMRFTLPADRVIAVKLLETILSYRFKIDEVADYKQAHGMHTDTATQAPSKKQTAKQIATREAKEKVRAVAKKLWKKDPTITKADMVMHNEINSIPLAKDMTEKTLQGWIKDENPNKRPGRRPKKT